MFRILRMKVIAIGIVKAEYDPLAFYDPLAYTHILSSSERVDNINYIHGNNVRNV